MRGSEGGDLSLDQVLNPITKKNDITATIYGEKLRAFYQAHLYDLVQIQALIDTLRQPSSVYLGVDADWLYFRGAGIGYVTYARMRPSDFYVYVLDRERSDPHNGGFPFSKDSGRVTRRIHP